MTTQVSDPGVLRNMHRELSMQIKQAREQGLDATELIERHKQVMEQRRQVLQDDQHEKHAAPAEPELRVLSSLKDFKQLESRWQDLLDDSNAISPFLTQAWLGPWIETFAADWDLYIAVVEEGDRLVAAAPLMVGEETKNCCRRRVVRFVGTGPGLRGNYFSLIWREGASRDARQMLLGHLERLRQAGYVLQLEHLSPYKAGQETLTALLSAPRRELLLHTEFPCLHVALPSSFAEFIAQVPSSSRRNRLRRGDAPLRDVCDEVQYERCEEAGELDRFLDTLALFNIQRRRAMGHVSTWEDRWNMACRRQAFENMLQRDMLHFDLLHSDARPIAALVGFEYRNSYFCYNMGFDDGLAHYQPGHVLLRQRLEASIEAGLTHFDFLVGDAEYKRQYCVDAMPELCVTVLPRQRRVQLMYALRRLAVAVKGKPSAKRTGA